MGIFTAAVLAAVAVAGPLAAAVQAQPPAPAPATPAPWSDPASKLGQVTASRKPGGNVGIVGHGFLLDDGVVTTIDAPGATIATVLVSINDDGVIVGGVLDDVRRRGFVLENGTFTMLSAPGAFWR